MNKLRLMLCAHMLVGVATRFLREHQQGEGNHKMKVPAPIFFRGHPGHALVVNEMLVSMSRDPYLITATFLWNKALASHSSITNVAFYQSGLQRVGDPGS